MQATTGSGKGSRKNLKLWVHGILSARQSNTMGEACKYLLVLLSAACSKYCSLIHIWLLCVPYDFTGFNARGADVD